MTGCVGPGLSRCEKTVCQNLIPVRWVRREEKTVFIASSFHRIKSFDTPSVHIVYMSQSLIFLQQFQDTGVGFIDGTCVEGREIDLSGKFVIVAKSVADHADGYSLGFGY